MELNLIDQLTLLALDDKKGTLVTDSIAFAYALGGALVMELALEHRIDLSGKKIIIKDSSPTGDPMIDTYFNKIKASKKEKSLRSWVELLGNESNRIKEGTLDKLIKKRILEKKEDKILWIFSYNKYPTQNSRSENHLRARLYDIIVNSHRPEVKEVMLLNLIDVCNLGREVFGKEHSKTFKKKIKVINEYDHISSEISKSAKEIYETITALLIVIVATTITTSN